MPLMVIVLSAQLALIPGGRLVGEPIPDAPVVTIVMGVIIGVLIQREGDEDGGLTVFFGVTLIVPVA